MPKNLLRTRNTVIENRVRAIRRSLRLSQEEFGKALGVSKHVVHSWEAGRVKVTDDMLENIKASFNAS